METYTSLFKLCGQFKTVKDCYSGPQVTLHYFSSRFNTPFLHYKLRFNPNVDKTRLANYVASSQQFKTVKDRYSGPQVTLHYFSS